MSPPSPLEWAQPQQLFELARQHQADGRLGDAKPLYERLLQQSPNNATATTLLASIAYQQGDDIQAEAYLDRAIDIYLRVLDGDPRAMTVRASLVNLLLARDRLPEAENFIEPLALPLNPIRAAPQEFDGRRRAGQAKGIPGVLFNTIPKSASESIWNKLAEGLGVAQSHVSLGLFPNCTLVPHRVGVLAEGGIIAKEHLAATAFNLRILAEQGIDRVVFHVRDPRQATLSWAHFVRDDVSMRLMGPLWRRIVPPAAVLKQDFDMLLTWCIEHYLRQLVALVGDWRRLRNDPQSPVAVKFMTFEQFVNDPAAYYADFLTFLGTTRSAFAEHAEAETVHLRKGQVDEWRNVFSRTLRDKAWGEIPGDMAAEFGWRR